MATIPLPALHTAPIAAPPNPLQMYGQMMGIQNAQQEMQQRQQMAPLEQQQAQNSVQSGALQVQEQQRQQASTKALMASFANLDPTDPNYFDKGIKAAQSSGEVLPGQIQSLMNTRLDYQTKVAGLTTAQQKEKQNRADSLYSVGTQALKLPDQNLMQDWPSLRSNIIDLHQGDQNFDPTSVPEQFPGRDWLQANTILQGMSAAGVRAAAAQQSAATGAATAAATHGPLSPDQIAQLNQGFQQRWNVLHPNQPMAAGLQLGSGATADDFNRLDKMMQGTETAEQAKATLASTQGYRNAQLSLLGQRVDLQKQQLGVGENGQPSELAQNIASGHIALDRMGYIVSRNPGILNQVTQIDPSFDSSKAESYPATYKDFTSGKTSVAINAGGTALNHLYELSKMNTVESHIPGTPDYNAYQNKADTVASELAKFYGDATIPAIDAIKSTLTAQLPGNRMAAIRTQAQSMGDKLDSYQQQWNNAAPSKAYEAPMPGISPQAIAARAALDPNFAAKQGHGGGQSTAAAGAQQQRPAGAGTALKITRDAQGRIIGVE